MIEDEFLREAADARGSSEPLPRPAVAKPVAARRINLALQGGGTHGAFTWGALDRLLADDRIEIEAVSGTSAGAVNAAVLVQGLCEGGRAGARKALERVWHDAGARLAFSPLQNTPFEKAIWGYDLTWSLAYQTFETVTRVLSPYQLNPTPFDFNPLRAVLEETIHPEVLREGKGPRLFISATSVRTGKPRVFSRPEVTVDVILASACLPQFFKAVEIDGEPFWDGGYLGNPALWPLYEQGGAPDLMLVQLNPTVRDELPTHPTDITNRLNEISFNASLMAEMRAIDFVQRLLDAGRLEQPRYRRLFVHVIEDEERMRKFKLSTKLNGDWAFLQTLKTYGWEAADSWLARNFDKLGRESSVDLRERFL
jgi:NTE family protein